MLLMLRTIAFLALLTPYMAGDRTPVMNLSGHGPA